MSDPLLMDNLEGILKAVSLIEERFADVKSADDFDLSAHGVLVLDSIAMRLQVIGELVKKIEKRNADVLGHHPNVAWAMIARLRDIISHHYDIIDHEIIYDICKNHVPDLKATILAMLHAASFPPGSRNL